MFLQRSAFALARRTPVRAVAKCSFTSSAVRRDQTSDQTKQPAEYSSGKLFPKVQDLKKDEDLLPPGGPSGTIPRDYEQATGVERLELLGKMQGIDVWDMRPLDSSRLGTFNDPIMVKSAGDEQYAGCTGYPADSHNVIWLTLTRERPFERCSECGNCLKMQYIGPEAEDLGHDDHHHHESYQEPKTFADYVKPEYWYK